MTKGRRGQRWGQAGWASQAGAESWGRGVGSSKETQPNTAAASHPFGHCGPPRRHGHNLGYTTERFSE